MRSDRPRWDVNGSSGARGLPGFGRRGNRRRRRARLTVLGRASIGFGLAVLLGVGWAARAGWQAWRARPDGALPPVSAAPPPVTIESAGRLDAPASRERFGGARVHSSEIDPSAAARLVEWRDATGRLAEAGRGLRVEYTLDEALTDDVFEVLRRGRVDRGHAIVIDPRSARVLALASTDPERFPAERAYPAASIVKVLTAAALLDAEERGVDTTCVYRGNKYRLNRRRLDRPSSGRRSGLEEALASSNNQCFSQWALHVVGEERLRSTFAAFGWLEPPAPGFEAGRVEPIESRLDLGRLGSGLDGLRVTLLHAAELTSVLTDGRLRESWWIDRVVDPKARVVRLPERRAERVVLSPERAAELREMLVATTTRGTAKGAFRDRRGRKLLGPIRVAGKTGNLTGQDPFGRYEWFVGVAPAEDPVIGVVVLQLQSNLWWKKSSELAASILQRIFCERRDCRVERAHRFTGDLGPDVEPLHVSTLDRPFEISRTFVQHDDEARTIRR